MELHENKKKKKYIPFVGKPSDSAATSTNVYIYFFISGMVKD